MTMPDAAARHFRQRGLSLIEVLVAIIVLSIGILGTAALHIQSKRANLGSVERTLASMLANDIFERMRANPGQADVYLAGLHPSQQVGVSGATEPTSCLGVSASCGPAALAAWDVWDWEQALIGASETIDDINTGGLVLPLACLTGPPGGGPGVYTVVISWRGHAEFTDAGTVPDPCNANATGRYDGDSGVGTLRRELTIRTYLDD